MRLNKRLLHKGMAFYLAAVLVASNGVYAYADGEETEELMSSATQEAIDAAVGLDETNVKNQQDGLETTNNEAVGIEKDSPKALEENQAASNSEEVEKDAEKEKKTQKRKKI